MRRQRVRIARAGVDVAFARGETIWTESSYKYPPEEVVALGEGAGFTCAKQWLDDARFALTLFRLRA